MNRSTEKTGKTRVRLARTLGFLMFMLPYCASAQMSHWMHNNLEEFGDHTLETLSLPGSHDAMMYEHDPDLFDMSVDNLYAWVELDVLGIGTRIDLEDFGILPGSPYTGILTGGQVISLIDQLMAAVAALDTQCTPDIPLIGVHCYDFGFSERLWDWAEPYYNLALGTAGDLSITQNLDLLGQLNAGARIFDLRPKMLNNRLYTHHSQSGLNEGDDVSWGYDLEIPIPCIPVPLIGCFPGTGTSYPIGSVDTAAGGTVRAVSATGPRLAEIFDDIHTFLEGGQRELVVLEVHSYWKGYNGNDFDEDDHRQLAELFEDLLGAQLLREDMLSATPPASAITRLRNARLSDMLATGGKVVATVESVGSMTPDPAAGLWPRNVTSASGKYANRDTLAGLIEDQDRKISEATQSRFALWWTLTCQPENIDCAVRDLAATANPHLRTYVEGLGLPVPTVTTLNEIWVDFFEETEAADLAVELNRANAPQPAPAPTPGEARHIPTMGWQWLCLTALLTALIGFRANGARRLRTATGISRFWTSNRRPGSTCR